jgi:hypothetical protein
VTESPNAANLIITMTSTVAVAVLHQVTPP